MSQGLPANRTSLIEAMASGRRFDLYFFYGHRQKQRGAPDASCLSQWFPASFVINGRHYATAEHWMMAGNARLFEDDAALERIVASDDPGEAKALGRRVRGFDEDRWTEARFDLVMEGNVAKFGQNAALGTFLQNTGHRVLVEAAPRDVIWGIGLGADDPEAKDPRQWRGQNLLGFALMHARAELRES